MAIKSAYSTEPTPEGNVTELASQLSDLSARLVVFFASSAFDPAEIGAAMQARFAGANVIGCTTAGEIASGKMLKNAIVAMAFDDDALKDVTVGVVEDLHQVEAQVQRVFNGFEAHTGQGILTLDVAEYVGLVLVDGLSVAEERLMDQIGNRTNVCFIGGSAGDDLEFERTYVFANGTAYTNAAVLALLKPARGFDVIKTQSFRDLGKVQAGQPKSPRPRRRPKSFQVKNHRQDRLKEQKQASKLKKVR